MASIEDVARQARVSPITVSRVIRKHPNVRRATRERVERAIADLKYIPNAAARSLKQSRSGMIGFLISDIGSPFYTTVTRGAEDAARAAGLSLVLGNCDEDPSTEAEYLRVLGERRVDGIILAPTDKAAIALDRYLPPGTPIVLFDRSLPGIDADLVRCDTERGVRALTRHLLALGHRRIALVGGNPTVSTWPERVAGYQAALCEAGQVADPNLVIPGDYKEASGAAAVRALLAGGAPPDAVIAANSMVALGALAELAIHDLGVPDDIAVAAVDNPLPTIPFWPTFTVVQQPGYEMGKAAVELLVAQMRGDHGEAQPWKLVFDAELQIGTSCGEARA